MKRIWDITPSVSVKTPVFPGDTPFEIVWNEQISHGGVANVSTIRMTPHVGAHIDAPMHLDIAAKDVAALRLETFLGRCRVIDLSDRERQGPIEPDELEEKLTCERILLKTRKVISKVWTDDFCAVSPAAVRLMKQSGVFLIGLDIPSIDPADSELLPAHRIALLNGISIIENLDLSSVQAGNYELIALPLRLEGVEASPVRAVLRTLTR